MKITENFSWSEVQCRCGCDMPPDVKRNVEKLIVEVDAGIRTPLGLAVTPTSVYRCENHNAIIGGAPDSKHLKGQAIDFLIRRKHGLVSGQWIAGFISAQILAGNMSEGGIGTYSGSRRNVCHYDNGSPYPRRWHHG